MFSIGQVSEMVGLPASTLRFYDHEGFFPGMEHRVNGRVFTEKELETVELIQCLKKTGMGIKEIKQFVSLGWEGPSTYGQRRALLQTRKEALEREVSEMERSLAMLKFKCWYYEQAQADGSEEQVQKLLPDNLPKAIQALYDKATDEHD